MRFLACCISGLLHSQVVSVRPRTAYPNYWGLCSRTIETYTVSCGSDSGAESRSVDWYNRIAVVTGLLSDFRVSVVIYERCLLCRLKVPLSRIRVLKSSS